MAADSLRALDDRRMSARDGWLVAALLAAVTALSLLLGDHLSVTSAAMLYVLGVVIIAYTAPRLAALLFSVVSVVALNFFFVPPRFAFRVDADENVTALLAMLAVAIVISERGSALRRKAADARLSAARARQLQELATVLADAREPADVARAGERVLQQAFPGEGKVVLGDGAALPQARGRLPVETEGETHGTASVPPEAIAADADRLHAQAICSLLAQALRRLKLTAAMQAAEDSARWHRAQNTFLAAISHDFRTPLAAIVTAASSLQDQHDKLGPQERERLTRILLEEAAHLSTMTENTLQLARLENAGEIHRDWQSVEEIVGTVVARLRKRERGSRIHTGLPAQLPLIQGDPVLLGQLLDNLVDNALKYSDGDVDIVAGAQGDWLELAVQDRGPGVPPGQEERIFEPYRRGDRSGQRGSGLGLAVCRAIARAHGGELLLRPRDGGGSAFVLRLPVPPLP